MASLEELKALLERCNGHYEDDHLIIRELVRNEIRRRERSGRKVAKVELKERSRLNAKAYRERKKMKVELANDTKARRKREAEKREAKAAIVEGRG